MGKDNPGGGNMPIGLMMSLAQHEVAMAAFGRMNDAEQRSVIQYVTGSSTGEEAKQRIRQAVEALENGSSGFFG